MSEKAFSLPSSGDALDRAVSAQREASDPGASSWVGASAGSGKTKVLTDRMLRLLLPREDGSPPTEPDKILALTFTKAGASEMSLRLSKKLSAWAVMKDTALEKELLALTGRQPRAGDIEAARKLFAKTVDVPGGLKIMTIHAFCQSVLGRFPAEADVVPNFKPLEEYQAASLIKEATDRILSHAGTDLLSPLHTALKYMSRTVTRPDFEKLLSTFLSERHQVRHVLKRSFGVEGLRTNLSTFFGFQGLPDEAVILREFCEGAYADIKGLRKACTYLATGKDQFQKSAKNIQAFWDAETDERTSLLENYKQAFLTQKATVKVHLANDTLKSEFPEGVRILEKEAERLLKTLRLWKDAACIHATYYLFLLANSILEEYDRIKTERGALDFDDMILTTLSLLKRSVGEGLPMIPWVLYKLDGGIDHILVDEAQDTNPEQWEIIRLLAGEFFTGQSTRDYVRTIFVVGDKKQSIFGFQRAAPEKFDEMYEWFESKIRQASQKFKPVDMSVSFRSVQAVLEAVDTIFHDVTAAPMGTDYLNHMPVRTGQPGLVEVWPLLRSSTESENENWFTPDKIVETRSGSLQTAIKIGDTIEYILGHERLESYDRPVRPGDIMILVKSRNAIVAQLVRILKSKKIAVSGVDRMVLSEQLAVQDLCACAKFASLPEDDLTLATLLKSPFIGFDEEKLYALAQGRGNQSLWSRIQEDGSPSLLSWLLGLCANARMVRPYEFFSRLLQQPCPADPISGMRAVRARLGEDALDPIEEFLNASLNYERGNRIGLQQFIQWQEQGSTEIKRELEEAGEAVRIMTVHGSKGLQAPIVFLPDTVHQGSVISRERLYWPQKTGLDYPFYIPKSDMTPDRVCDALNLLHDKAQEEYFRLLYVAMTRAEERLYIGGYINKRGPGEASAYWYGAIRSSLENHPDIQKLESGIADKEGNDMPILRLERKASAAPDKKSTSVSTNEQEAVSLPAWARQMRPEEPDPPRPLAPSRPSLEEPAAASPLTVDSAFRFRRGTVTHKLLQILPDLEETLREDACIRYLEIHAADLPETVRNEIKEEIFSILHDPDYSALFGPDSLAEIPVTGLVSNGRLISGQIDRLVILPDAVLIVDYKTNRPAPKRKEDIPQTYILQMKAYADTLASIYPGKRIRAALLWTDGARLMEISV